MGSSLQINHQNTFWLVEEPFDVYVRVATTDSNTYYGSSKIYGILWQRVTVKPGDALHALAGGDFLIRDGEVYSIAIEMKEKHPFEKTYLPREPRWPLDKLTQIERTDRPDYSQARTRAEEQGILSFEDLRERGATRHERSIDWLLA